MALSCGSALLVGGSWTAKSRNHVISTSRARAYKPVIVKAFQEELNSTCQSGSHGVNYHHPPLSNAGYGFFMPPVTYIGKGALTSCGAALEKAGFKKALIVTDKVMAKTPTINAVFDMLKKNKVSYVVYDGVEPNPTVGQVMAGLAMLQKEDCDLVISFGGGSPHDAAKGIAVCATNGGDPRKYEGVDKAAKAMMPMVAINTTAGTASELTRFSIITDETRHVKMALVDAKLTPFIAVDDSDLMLSMPKGLTAATGMDALTHAIEAYVSSASNPVTDSAALHAIRLISAYLRDSVHKACPKARDMMAYAQYLAGVAFNSAGLGYVHAMAHQLGGFYNLPHGVCNAVLLPVIAEYNAKVVPALFIDIAQAMGATFQEDQQVAAAQFVIGEIKRLSKDVGIPKNLQELGVKTADFPTLADNALKDACGFTNPKQATKDEIIAMYKQAYEM